MYQHFCDISLVNLRWIVNTRVAGFYFRGQHLKWIKHFCQDISKTSRYFSKIWDWSVDWMSWQGLCWILLTWYQGCWKLFRAGGESRETGIQGAGGESRGQIVQKRHFTVFCYYTSLLILAQSNKILIFFAVIWPLLRCWLCNWKTGWSLASYMHW